MTRLGFIYTNAVTTHTNVIIELIITINGKMPWPTKAGALLTIAAIESLLFF
jgi:hypothetical protein